MKTGDRPAHDWTAVLRRLPARIVAGRPEGGYTNVFEIICCDCGDQPYLDYREVSPELQRTAGHTRSQPGSLRMKNTSGCTAHPPASPRLADTRKFQPRDASGGCPSVRETEAMG